MITARPNVKTQYVILKGKLFNSFYTSFEPCLDFESTESGQRFYRYSNGLWDVVGYTETEFLAKQHIGERY